MIKVFSDKYPEAAVNAANEFLADKEDGKIRELVSMSAVIDADGHYVLTVHYNAFRRMVAV